LDHVLHQQDMRRPLGIPRTVPEARLVAALDVAPRLGRFVKSKKRAAGMRFKATDITWTHGDGPEVQGPGEALLVALAGRPVALDELTGDGLETLRGRLAA